MRSPLRIRLLPSVTGRALTALALTVLSLAALSLTACATGTRARRSAALPASVADSVHTERLAPGVQLHTLVWTAAPWRAVALDVDLTACTSLRAVKGGAGAAGRRTTSALLAGLPASERPIAAVNADFFLFAPAGLPVGAHVERETLVAGPVDRPVFAVLRDGTPWIGRLTVTAELRTVRGSTRLASWNRPTRNVPGVIDRRWGVPPDSTVQGARWRLEPAGARDRFVARAWSRERAAVVTGDTLLLVEWRDTPSFALRDGDSVTVSRSVAPDVREVVGGFPLLARDSLLSPTIDSDGAVGFRGVNPRTAVGIANRGTRVFLIVIDGRQPAHSVGTSTRETAGILLSMGAHDALNLDGGGSSALVVRSVVGDSVVTRVMNKPSDAVGERPVANALAVLGACGR